MTNFKLKTQHILDLSSILGTEKTMLLVHVYQHGSNGNKFHQTDNSISDELGIPFESVWYGMIDLYHRGLIRKEVKEHNGVIYHFNYYIDYSCIEQLGKLILITNQVKEKTKKQTTI